MRRQEKADLIGEILDDLYPDPPIPLDHSSPYELLVAVALSAQTTDKKVNEDACVIFCANTPQKMALLEPDEILTSYVKSVLPRPRQKSSSDGRADS